MAIKRKSALRKQEINLDGPDGNAFVLLGYAQAFAKKLGKDGSAITKEMRSGDYEALITVFDREFGDIVDLVKRGRRK